MVQELESEAQRKAREIEELRAQEKFMMVGTGEADCLSCGFKYDPKAGDPDYPVSPGTKFQVRQCPFYRSSNPLCCWELSCTHFSYKVLCFEIYGNNVLFVETMHLLSLQYALQ